MVQLKWERVALKKTKQTNKSLIWSSKIKKKSLIYFQIKYCGWNYGCHSINPGRAERQSLVNLLFILLQTQSYDMQSPWLCSHPAEEAAGSSRSVFLPLCACLCQHEVAPRKELCLKLYSADSQCHKWGTRTMLKKTPSPYKFHTSPDLEFLGERQNVFISYTINLFFTHMLFTL